jgi:hypothetical protein
MVFQRPKRRAEGPGGEYSDAGLTTAREFYEPATARLFRASAINDHRPGCRSGRLLSVEGNTACSDQHNGEESARFEQDVLPSAEMCENTPPLMR